MRGVMRGAKGDHSGWEASPRVTRSVLESRGLLRSLRFFCNVSRQVLNWSGRAEEARAQQGQIAAGKRHRVICHILQESATSMSVYAYV